MAKFSEVAEGAMNFGNQDVECECFTLIFNFKNMILMKKWGYVNIKMQISKALTCGPLIMGIKDFDVQYLKHIDFLLNPCKK